MVRIRETDYHHGSLTTVLINNGYNLVLLETHESRRSYKLTNNTNELIIYAKYSSRPSSRGRNGSSLTWSFSFADEEIAKIKGYINSNNNCLIALISSYGDSTGGKLVLLNINEFLKCIGEGWNATNPRIAVRKEKYRQVRVYGTGLDSTNAFIPKTDLATVMA